MLTTTDENRIQNLTYFEGKVMSTCCALRHSWSQTLLLSVCLLLTTTAGSAWVQNNPALRNIDTHIHLDGIYRSGNSWLSDFDAAAHTALAAMDEAGVKMSLLMPPPFSPEKANSPVWEDLARKVGYENVERVYKLTGNATNVVQDAQSAVPGTFRLDQNYPNPFNPTTTIPFSLFRKEHVTLKMFDVLGREVAMLIDGKFTAGEHSAVYHAERLTSGVYFYRLKSGREVRTRKLLLLQ